MYTGIGKRISNLAGRARPSFALIFDKNKLKNIYYFYILNFYLAIHS